MSRRGENIYKRKDGRWEGRYLRTRTPAGKAKFGYVYAKSYREVKEKLSLAKQGIKDKSEKSRLLADFCDEWLTLSRNRVKESTYVKYYNTVNRHIKPQLGGCLPKNMNTVNIEQFSNSLLSQGLSRKSVKDILIVLQSILKHCKKETDIREVDIVFPKEERKEIRVMTIEEQRRLADFLSRDTDSVKFGILLALLTGMRIGEICALRWENILLDEGLIRVTSTMQRLQDLERTDGTKTKITVTEAKSNRSIRIIPMSNTAVSLCKRMCCNNKKAFVLTASAERYIEPRMLQYRLLEYTGECGIEKVHFHTLRHTFATRCVEVGFEIKTLSEILGHSSAKITLDRYVHPSLELKRANIEKLSAVGL